MSFSAEIRHRVVHLPRPLKQAISVGSDTIGFSVCACIAEWLTSQSGLIFHTISIWCLVAAVVSVFFVWWQGFYRSIVRYLGWDLFIAGAKTALASSVVAATVMFLAGMTASPARWGVCYFGLAFIFLCSSRYVARMLLIPGINGSKSEPVIVYGAGSAGAQLIVNLKAASRFSVTAMVDDDSRLHGKLIKGIEIYPASKLDELITQFSVKRVLLAMPSATRRQRKGVLERLSHHKVYVQTIPDIGDIVSGKARVDELSDVAVEDLLGRDPVPPINALLDESIGGKVVMVTGAGGSIGSELCRQILQHSPARLVLYEVSEPALYEIEMDLLELRDSVREAPEINAVLGSVQNGRRVREAITKFGVDIVFHAAAYKHVPIVERNVIEGVENNIFGTLRAVEAAAEAGIEKFVLVSTDKAVNPTNVMGATKRFAELILQAFQVEHPGTVFCMVRFGNVLESSGSVVPRFRKQIRAGGPVTVTDPDIIRYFMTIPEAAELVIQAAAMARGGDVFVLDMGEPVRIKDLAYRMISLMGLTAADADNPNGDIEVVYTGLRPAEKLYEELLIGGDVSETRHPRILRARERRLEPDQLGRFLAELAASCSTMDRAGAREVLERAIAGYRPSNGIEDSVSLQPANEGRPESLDADGFNLVAQVH